MTDYIDVDVRPILRAGGEPFSVIMAALERLEPGRGCASTPTFKPIPLFAVMADKASRIPSRRSTAASGRCCSRRPATKQTASPPAPRPSTSGPSRLSSSTTATSILRSRWSGSSQPPRSSGRRNLLGATAARARLPVSATREAWISLARRLLADGATYELTVRAPS